MMCIPLFALWDVGLPIKLPSLEGGPESRYRSPAEMQVTEYEPCGVQQQVEIFVTLGVAMPSLALGSRPLKRLAICRETST